MPWLPPLPPCISAITSYRSPLHSFCSLHSTHAGFLVVAQTFGTLNYFPVLQNFCSLPLGHFPPNICVLCFLTSLRSWPQYFPLDVLTILCKTTMYLLSIFHPFFPARFIVLAFIVYKFNEIRDFFVCLFTSVSLVFKMILAHVSHQKYMLDKAGCPVVLPSLIIFIKYFSYSCSKQHVGTVLKPSVKGALQRMQDRARVRHLQTRVGLRANFSSQCCCSIDGS